MSYVRESRLSRRMERLKPSRIRSFPR